MAPTSKKIPTPFFKTGYDRMSHYEFSHDRWYERINTCICPYQHSLVNITTKTCYPCVIDMIRRLQSTDLGTALAFPSYWLSILPPFRGVESYVGITTALAQLPAELIPPLEEAEYIRARRRAAAHRAIILAALLPSIGILPDGARIAFQPPPPELRSTDAPVGPAAAVPRVPPVAPGAPGSPRLAPNTAGGINSPLLRDKIQSVLAADASKVDADAAAPAADEAVDTARRRRAAAAGAVAEAAARASGGAADATTADDHVAEGLAQFIWEIDSAEAAAAAARGAAGAPRVSAEGPEGGTSGGLARGDGVAAARGRDGVTAGGGKGAPGGPPKASMMMAPDLVAALVESVGTGKDLARGANRVVQLPAGTGVRSVNGIDVPDVVSRSAHYRELAAGLNVEPEVIERVAIEHIQRLAGGDAPIVDDDDVPIPVPVLTAVDYIGMEAGLPVWHHKRDPTPPVVVAVMDSCDDWKQGHTWTTPVNWEIHLFGCEENRVIDPVTGLTAAMMVGLIQTPSEALAVAANTRPDGSLRDSRGAGGPEWVRTHDRRDPVARANVPLLSDAVRSEMGGSLGMMPGWEVGSRAESRGRAAVAAAVGDGSVGASGLEAAADGGVAATRGGARDGGPSFALDAAALRGAIGRHFAQLRGLVAQGLAATAASSGAATRAAGAVRSAFDALVTRARAAAALATTAGAVDTSHRAARRAARANADGDDAGVPDDNNAANANHNYDNAGGGDGDVVEDDGTPASAVRANPILGTPFADVGRDSYVALHNHPGSIHVFAARGSIMRGARVRLRNHGVGGVGRAWLHARAAVDGRSDFIFDEGHEHEGEAGIDRDAKDGAAMRLVGDEAGGGDVNSLTGGTAAGGAKDMMGSDLGDNVEYVSPEVIQKNTIFKRGRPPHLQPRLPPKAFIYGDRRDDDDDDLDHLGFKRRRRRTDAAPRRPPVRLLVAPRDERYSVLFAARMIVELQSDDLPELLALTVRAPVGTTVTRYVCEGLGSYRVYEAKANRPCFPAEFRRRTPGVIESRAMLKVADVAAEAREMELEAEGEAAFAPDADADEASEQVYREFAKSIGVQSNTGIKSYVVKLPSVSNVVVPRAPPSSSVSGSMAAQVAVPRAPTNVGLGGAGGGDIVLPKVPTQSFVPSALPPQMAVFSPKSPTGASGARRGASVAAIGATVGNAFDSVADAKGADASANGDPPHVAAFFEDGAVGGVIESLKDEGSDDDANLDPFTLPVFICPTKLDDAGMCPTCPNFDDHCKRFEPTFGVRQMIAGPQVKDDGTPNHSVAGVLLLREAVKLGFVDKEDTTITALAFVVRTILALHARGYRLIDIRAPHANSAGVTSLEGRLLFSKATDAPSLASIRACVVRVLRGVEHADTCLSGAGTSDGTL